MDRIELEDIMPQFDMQEIRQRFNEIKNHFVGNFLGGIEFAFNDFKDNGYVPVYLGPHTTCLDYVAANYSILENELPYPMSVVGSNLKNSLYNNSILDFSKWGVIWHNRNDDSFKHLKKYISAMEFCFRRRTPVLVYPEGGRNRKSGGELRPFKETLFRILVSLDDQLSRDGINLCVAPFATSYRDFPERAHWEKIDAGEFNSREYFTAEREALVAWKDKVKLVEKPNVRFGFGETFPIGNFSEGVFEERAATLSLATREKIRELQKRLQTQAIKTLVSN